MEKKSIHVERSPEKLSYSFQSTHQELCKHRAEEQQKRGVQLKDGMGQQCSAPTTRGQLEPAAAARVQGDTAHMVRELQRFLSLSHQKKEQGQHALRKLHRGVELRNTR